MKSKSFHVKHQWSTKMFYFMLISFTRSLAKDNIFMCMFVCLQDFMWVFRSVLCLSEQTGCSDNEETDGSHAIPNKTASHQIHINN